MKRETELFRYRPGQPLVWYRRRPEISNHYCPYCAVLVGPGSSVASNKEHLIGRNFVPIGSMAGESFNFIFRSCVSCNARKSAAEGHVSAVSLFNSRGRQDTHIDQLALQKASKQLHPGGRGKVVRDAFVEKELAFAPAPGVSIQFSLVGPPQLDQEAVHELAGMQIQGLFSMVTTEDPQIAEKMRVLPRDEIAIFGYYPESDWGNPHLVELDRRTLAWESILLINSASGYFQAVFKRSSDPEDGWFWALEWNRYVRIAGGIFHVDAPPAWATELPDLDWRVLPDGSGRHRREVSLPPGEDRLFSWREYATDLADQAEPI